MIALTRIAGPDLVGFADVLDSSDGVGIMSDEPRSG